MNELRWILLVAGLILIAGVYFWGMRSRSRRNEGVARRATPVGKGTFDPPPPMEAPRAAQTVTPPEPRRIEPSLSMDSDVGFDAAASRGTVHAVDFDVGEPEPPSPAPARRREPTISTRPEVARVSPAVSPAAQPEPAPVAPPDATKPAAETKPARKPQKIVAMRVTAEKPARFDGARLLEVLRAEGLEYGRYDIFHRRHENGRPIFSVSSLLEPGTFDLEAMPQTAYPGVMVFAVLPGPVSAREAFDEMTFTARGLATELKGSLSDEKGAPLTVQVFAKLREDALEFERSATGTG